MIDHKYRKSSFFTFVEAANDEVKKIMEKNPDVSFIKELSMSDYEYFKKIIKDAEQIDVHITWAFDEQQADPFHKAIRSDEFVRRLKRIVYEKSNQNG